MGIVPNTLPRKWFWKEECNAWEYKSFFCLNISSGPLDITAKIALDLKIRETLRNRMIIKKCWVYFCLYCVFETLFYSFKEKENIKLFTLHFCWLPFHWIKESVEKDIFYLLIIRSKIPNNFIFLNWKFRKKYKTQLFICRFLFQNGKYKEIKNSYSGHHNNNIISLIYWKLS